MDANDSLLNTALHDQHFVRSLFFIHLFARLLWYDKRTMHPIFKFILITTGNAFALWLANQWVPGFVLSASIPGLVITALFLTVLNYLLKPVLTILLGPLIIVTLGLGLIIVNAIVLRLLAYASNHLDFMHGSVTIQTIPALFFSTIIVSAVNFIIHLL